MWGQMMLSRLYTNKPDFFSPVDFLPGLNVVLAEIRLPHNKNRDTHNLGKTTFGSVIDFCLLSGKSSNFFLFKYPKIFGGLVFFIELALKDGTYATLRRSVDAATLISFKYHDTRGQEFTTLDDAGWDHLNITFDKAKDLLDGILDWRDISPWPFRKLIGYLLRTQDDYREVFQLRKFQSRHIDWKPVLARILGFDGELIESQYKKALELEEVKKQADIIKDELGGAIEDISKIEGLLSLKRQDAEKKQQLLDAFDFRSQDKEKTKRLVEEVDVSIAALNSERYRLSAMRRRVVAAIEDEQVLFDPDEAKALFAQAGVFFEGQLKRDFEQLLEFNRLISEERAGYLLEEKQDLDVEIRRISAELSKLGKQRSEALGFLSTTDVFEKYKATSDALVTVKADIQALERQQEGVHKLQEKRLAIRALTEESGKLKALVEDNVAEVTSAESKSLFSSVRLYFSEIVELVIKRKALLRVYTNEVGHLEFKAEILDDSGNTTSADLGHTYRKLLCVAFDLALLRAHSNGEFPRFVYHDGVFEKLDPRKKDRMLQVLREYVEHGIQVIITLLDSEMPPNSDDGTPPFEESEVIVLLHDEDDSGRLFKGPSW
jgi:uncharacterized protein YydD (DUF2326 family)